MAETRNVPLAVDLDGTLIRTDLMFESLARLLRRNPLAIFQILYWWARGRARLKQALAARVRVDPATLPYHEPFLAWLRQEKKSGRVIVLATASDHALAAPVADHLGIFDGVLASDGKTNLRSASKLRALTEKFGARGFDYAGNSSADFAVWRGSRQAVVVNASPAVRREAAQCTAPGPVFCDGYRPLEVPRRFCLELFWRSGYLVAVLAGLLLATAFPKWSFAGFAWVAPALLLWAAQGRSGAEAFRVGYVSGFAFWLASLYWLLLIPCPFFPILGWLALAAYLALFTGAWTWLIGGLPFPASLWSGRLFWTLGGAAAWVALEMVRARLLGGFPWSFIGISQYKLVPLIQLASVTGVYGVSFLVVWFSLALLSAGRMILAHPGRRFTWQAEIFFPLFLTLVCFIGGFFALDRGTPGQGVLHVTMVQPDIPQTTIWDPAVDETRFQQFLAQNEAALATNRPDVLVWPESAVPAMSVENVAALCNLVRRHHVWLILNGEDSTVTPAETNWFNAAFLVNPRGELAATYHKQKLVIFGEYVPLVRWLPFLKWFTPIVGGWTPGDRPAVFQVNRQPEPAHASVIELDNNPSGAPPVTANGAPLICFEDAFATVARGATQKDLDFFVNLTNDGWFGDSSEQWQHLAAAVFRAVENGLPLLRCANNGITCYIDGHGRLEEIFRDPQGSEYGIGALNVDLPLLAPAEKSAPTFYNRHGDYFGWSCVGVSVVTLLRRFRKSPK